MKLHWSPRSPFVRKVMVAAHELGLADRLAPVRTVVAMASPPPPALLADNPLGKIPTLVLEDGTALYDSAVIVEHLETLAGRRLVPAGGPARLLELRRHALADGFLDLLVLWRNERGRAAPDPALVAAFGAKTEAVLAALEAEISAIAEAPVGLAQITIAIAGAYLDFRFPELGWRGRCPRLDAWQRRFEERPSMQATRIVDA